MLSSKRPRRANSWDMQRFNAEDTAAWQEDALTNSIHTEDAEPDAIECKNACVREDAPCKKTAIKEFADQCIYANHSNSSISNLKNIASNSEVRCIAFEENLRHLRSH